MRRRIVPAGCIYVDNKTLQWPHLLRNWKVGQAGKSKERCYCWLGVLEISPLQHLFPDASEEKMGAVSTYSYLHQPWRRWAVVVGCRHGLHTVLVSERRGGSVWLKRGNFLLAEAGRMGGGSKKGSDLRSFSSRSIDREHDSTIARDGQE